MLKWVHKMPLPGYDANAPTGGGVSQSSSSGPPNSPLDISPTRSLDDVSFVASQQLNQGGVAEGSTVPPQQDGDFRVPRPSAFAVASGPIHAGVSSVYILTWVNVDPSAADIAGYRIYVQNALQTNQQPQLVGTAAGSPGTVYVPSIGPQTTITFWLQPFTTGGLTLPLSACPTCSVVLPQGFLEFDLTDPTSGDGVAVVIDNNIISGGSPIAGFETVDTTDNNRAIVAPHFIAVLTRNQLLAASLSVDAATGNIGSVKIADSTGNASVITITNVIDPGPRVASGSYLKIISGVGGGATNYYLPLFT